MDIILSFWNFLKQLDTWKLVFGFVYGLYSFIRAWAYSDYLSENDFKTKKKVSLWYAYKKGIFGCDKSIRIYHIIIMLIDMPAVLIGFFIPIVKRLFRFKLYTFKEEQDDKETDTEKN